jgi:hypothetical protein
MLLVGDVRYRGGCFRFLDGVAVEYGTEQVVGGVEASFGREKAHTKKSAIFFA